MLQFYSRSKFGFNQTKNSTRYWLDDLYCYGHEENLGHCWSRTIGIHNCEEKEEAGVICTNKTDPGRLKPIPSRESGKVRWGSVNSRNFAFRLKGSLHGSKAISPCWNAARVHFSGRHSKVLLFCSFYIIRLRLGLVSEEGVLARLMITHTYVRAGQGNLELGVCLGSGLG